LILLIVHYAKNIEEWIDTYHFSWLGRSDFYFDGPAIPEFIDYYINKYSRDCKQLSCKESDEFVCDGLQTYKCICNSKTEFSNADRFRLHTLSAPWI